MGLLDLPKHDILLARAQEAPGVDVSVIETLMTLQETVNHLNTSLEDFLAQFHLSQGRFTLLLLLSDESEGLPPSLLAERAGVRRPTVTGLLAGLERDGLISRRHDRSDKRKYTVRPTPAARELLDEVLHAYFRRVSNWMGAVSGGGRRTLVSVLTAIEDRLGDQPMGDSPPIL